MTTRFIKALLVLALGGLGLVAVSCGGDGESSAQSGGTMNTIDMAGGVDSLDPGYWYYQQDYAQLANTTQRQLYGWKPDETKPTPDLAEDLPEVSNGGKTVTIKLKPNIKYSAPLQTRTVKSADVKYGARALLPAAGRQRLRKRLLRRHRGREGLPGQEGRRGIGHRDARRPDARDQLDGTVRHPRRRQRARHALHRAHPEGLRPEVRRGQAVDLRPAPGLHRPVHDRERRQGQDHGLRAQQAAGPGPEPELGKVDRLQAGVLRQDRRDVLQRCHGRGQEDALRTGLPER